MNIAVCIKSVPDPQYYEKITIDPESKRLVRDGIPAIINEADLHAMEAALRLKEACGGEIIVISMGPPAAKKQLVEALAMGADRAFLISDRKVGGADSLATSYTLAKTIETTGQYDVIFTGSESADGATAHVPSQIGVWMGMYIFHHKTKKIKFYIGVPLEILLYLTLFMWITEGIYG